MYKAPRPPEKFHRRVEKELSRERAIPTINQLAVLGTMYDDPLTVLGTMYDDPLAVLGTMNDDHLAVLLTSHA
jgi:hypothetical protein